MRRLARVQRFDFWIAVAALAATLVFGVLAGVAIGVAMSLIWLISVASRPNLPLLGREKGTDAYRDLNDHPDDEQCPGIAVVRLDAGLFFANSDAVEDRVRELIHARQDITGIVIDCGGINFVDSQGTAKIADILGLTSDAGVTLHLARVKPAVAATLKRDGVWDRLGPDRIHANIDQAVRAQPQGLPPPAAPRG
jgi:SulP family sulfate permease